MGKIQEGTLLWEPSEERINESALYDYINWLKKHKIIHINNYNELWNWSVNDIESFWESMWQYFDIQSEDPYKTVLTSHEMPGARDRKSTRLNSSHVAISYAVFCLKK